MSEPTTTSAVPDDRPPLSARDLSWYEAQAGIAARESAAQAGGSPEQVRALVHAGVTQAASLSAPGARTLGGLPLQPDNLLVTLCLNLYAQAHGSDPRAMLAEKGSRMQALAVLAYLFTQPAAAFEFLDAATDATLSDEARAAAKRGLRHAAITFAADFGPEDLDTLTNHLLRLAGHQPATEDDNGAGEASGREASSSPAPAPPAAGSLPTATS